MDRPTLESGKATTMSPRSRDRGALVQTGAIKGWAGMRRGPWDIPCGRVNRSAPLDPLATVPQDRQQEN